MKGCVMLETQNNPHLITKKVQPLAAPYRVVL